MNEEKNKMIKIDKNGYFKLPDFFELNYKEKVFYINGYKETRLYSEKDMATVIDMYMKILDNEFDGNKKRHAKRKFYSSIIEVSANNGKIKLPEHLLKKNLDSIFVVTHQKHLKIFANEIEYEEYKSKFYKKNKEYNNELKPHF